MAAEQKKLIIGNWKMNLNIHEASMYVHKLDQLIRVRRDVEVVLAPTILTLQSLSLQIDNRKFKLAAQNFYWRDDGAFTGEVSANQLRGLVKYGLVGHSERRHVFHEPGRDTGRKVQAAIRHGIRPVLCVGETAFERSEGETRDILHDQLVAGLANVTSTDMKELAIAYEPVWAIGTGNNATPTDVKQVARAIRSQLKYMFGERLAKQVPILYGGSVNQHNAGGYLDAEGIDGLLIGGASLKADEFAAIVARAHTGADD